MLLTELVEVLESTGYPVAYLAFDESEDVDPPFIVYESTGTHPFAADGEVYFSSTNVTVYLFTKNKNESAEGKIEAVLASIFYNKTEKYLNEETCYQVAYEMEI